MKAGPEQTLYPTPRDMNTPSQYLIERFYECLAENDCRVTDADCATNYNETKETATACASKAIEYAEGFAEWTQPTYVFNPTVRTWHHRHKFTEHTTTELRQQYEQYLETIKTK
jgi:hypothetical protein